MHGVADPPDEDAEPEAVTAAADALYDADPQEFLDVRKQLVAQARANGDGVAAKQIAALRKPTVAAWIVNRQVRQDPDVVTHLLELNDQLRAAHDEFDATALRDLSAQRRELVERLTRAALELAERGDAGAPLRDEVFATFDAAAADPQIAAQLGRLHRAQHWSGFGVAPPVEGAGPPALRLLRGGRNGTAATQAAREEKPTAAQRREARTKQRALAKANAAFEQAEAELTSAENAERASRDRVRELGDELARLQAEASQAKDRLEQARREAKAARARHREARSALDRAERNAQR
jgi:hypothetical protein